MRDRRSVRRAFAGSLVAAMLLAGPCRGGTAGPFEPRAGDFTIQADGISESIFAETARRFGTEADPSKPPRGVKAHAGEKVSWQVYVPPSTRRGPPAGLLVWISSSSRGGVPRPWRSVLDKHRLAWIGANDSGNPVWTLRRHVLAVEAVEQFRRRGYEPDARRVYVSGISGGGRIASHVALVHADVFAGGLYVIGCNYYRNVTMAPRQVLPGFWRRPDRKLLAKARKDGRFVLLTGETDFNREQMEKIHAAYRKDGFRHATYLQVPGMGHSLPPADWFEKAVLALDAPLRPAKAKPTSKPKPAPRSQPATRPVAGRAQSRLKLARVYLANGLRDKARKTLEELLREHPGTPQAAQARRLLADLKP